MHEPHNGAPIRLSQPTPPAAEEARGLLSSLFDLSFTTFITSKLIKVVYALAIAFAALVAAALLVSGFSQGTLVGLLMLIVAPIVFLAIVIYARVILEIMIVVFRMAEHLAEIAQQGRRLA
jgi:Domain of unknown function (DUF4282)